MCVSILGMRQHELSLGLHQWALRMHWAALLGRKPYLGLLWLPMQMRPNASLLTWTLVHSSANHDLGPSHLLLRVWTKDLRLRLYLERGHMLMLVRDLRVSKWGRILWFRKMRMRVRAQKMWWKFLFWEWCLRLRLSLQRMHRTRFFLRLHRLRMQVRCKRMRCLCSP